jgi:hypothetical protein
LDDFSKVIDSGVDGDTVRTVKDERTTGRCRDIARGENVSRRAAIAYLKRATAYGDRAATRDGSNQNCGPRIALGESTIIGNVITKGDGITAVDREPCASGDIDITAADGPRGSAIPDENDSLLDIGASGLSVVSREGGVALPGVTDSAGSRDGRTDIRKADTVVEF